MPRSRASSTISQPCRASPRSARRGSRAACPRIPCTRTLDLDPRLLGAARLDLDDVVVGDLEVVGALVGSRRRTASAASAARGPRRSRSAPSARRRCSERTDIGERARPLGRRRTRRSSTTTTRIALHGSPPPAPRFLRTALIACEIARAELAASRRARRGTRRRRPPPRRASSACRAAAARGRPRTPTPVGDRDPHEAERAARTRRAACCSRNAAITRADDHRAAGHRRGDLEHVAAARRPSGSR